MRGEIITLKDEVRFIDAAAKEAPAQVKEQVDVLSQKCVEFLLQPESLDPIANGLNSAGAWMGSLRWLRAELEEITTAGSDLEMLIDIVGLSIDTTGNTSWRITAIYQVVNQVKEALKNKMRSLMTAEGPRSLTHNFAAEPDGDQLSGHVRLAGEVR